VKGFIYYIIESRIMGNLGFEGLRVGNFVLLLGIIWSDWIDKAMRGGIVRH
jgi:hypothetical protein